MVARSDNSNLSRMSLVGEKDDSERADSIEGHMQTDRCEQRGLSFVDEAQKEGKEKEGRDKRDVADALAWGIVEQGKAQRRQRDGLGCSHVPFKIGLQAASE